jgi:Uma2 family endonuclease
MRAVIAEMPKHWLAERATSDAAQWDEIWNGELHMPPMPNRMHQYLERDLMNYVLKRWALPNGNDVTHQVNLTTPIDEPNWRNNYRIPDLVLLTPDRFHIDKGEYMAGAPLVCVEVYSPGDDSYQKLDFYAGLGVPEVWIIARDSRETDLYLLRPDGTYSEQPIGPGGWVCSPATGIELRPTPSGKLAVRMNGDESTEEVIPVGK